MLRGMVAPAVQGWWIGPKDGEKNGKERRGSEEDAEQQQEQEQQGQQGRGRGGTHS